jgi:hypothetical protein
MRVERKVYRVLLEKPEGKRPIRRTRRTREDGIRMDFWEMCVEWILLAHDRGPWRALANTVTNLRVLEPRN